MVSYWNISLGQTYCSFSDLSRGPTYSYDILYSFQPWDEVAESYSQMESHCMQTGRPQWDFFSNGPREVSYNHLAILLFHYSTLLGHAIPTSPRLETKIT